MGFNSVYRGLIDVFPQIDSRILRAVAIENSKDIDKAAEVVLTEVLPFMLKGATISDSSNDSPDNANCTDREDHTMQLGSQNMNDIVGRAHVSSSHDANGDGDQLCRSGREKTVLPANSNMVMGPNQSLHAMSTMSECDDGNSNLDCQIKSNLQELCSNSNLLNAESFAAKQASPMVHECASDALGVGLRHTDGMIPEETEIPDHAPMEGISTGKEVGNGHESMNDLPTPEVVDAEQSMNDLPTHEVVDSEHEPSLTTEVSRSDQICRIDLLEYIIEGARDNKKTLFSAMESVISLMKEVEHREKAAEQLKEEAAKGDMDILTRVEDLKQMLRHAKEANDMHAGEVYGERAILATEAKELQSRLLSLSDERDNSLAILDEMRQTLEQRLDAADKEMKEAEQEKTKKEESARNALAEQELIMDKVVQESKMLKQEAEENSKLREFLMDRGRVVDVLQGEISVICKDVRLLKEKFDERAPLSESITSSQTSCRLASSSSSIKSLGLDQVPVQTEVTIETLEKPSTVPSNGHISPREEGEANDCEAVADDDGWEFFDKDNGWED